MKWPFWIFLCISSLSYGAEFLEFGEKGFNLEKIKESKWQFDVGADYMLYPSTLPGYKGTHEEIQEDEKLNIYGLHLSFGREFMLGGGLSTTFKLGGFYNKTLERSVGKAAEDIDIDLAHVRTDHMLYGGEATLALNYLIETSFVNFQPLVEFGIGRGLSNIEREYVFDGISGVGAEDYDIKVEENFNYAKTSIGINFLSSRGLLSYIKVTQIKAVVSDRKTTGTDGTQDLDEKETGLSEEKDIFSASLGFGFYY